MISRLHIENYALIDSLDIEFTPGLNIITGETGAGKSIMLGALSLLIGERAAVKAISVPDRKSIVEAEFKVQGHENLSLWATDNDIDWDNETCILRRELLPGGRSRAFINDTLVNLSQLGEVGRQLIDIHSQNQNQLLAKPEYQLQIIDSIGDTKAILEQYKIEYSEWKKAEKDLATARKTLQENRADEEFIRFRLSQLDEAQLVAGEQDELESERELQANMTQIKQTLTNALDALINGEHAVLTTIDKAVDATDELSELLENATELSKRLETARIEIQDIAETLEDYDANLGADPAALEQIEERLGKLYSLEQRHRVDTVEELITIRDNLRNRLELITDGDVTVDELAIAEVSKKNAAIATADRLTRLRKKAAENFAKELYDFASPLGMPNLSCEIVVEPTSELMPTGADRIEFLFAFNKNQPPCPVRGAASGGEVSRLMLSIKAIVVGKLQLPAIIFDEVDTGVSGDIANRMGHMMLDISNQLQVITITHLPQVAAKGESHYKVYKEDDTLTTHTRIRRLTDEERIGELALMLSGSATDEAAIANAKSLLKNGKK